jgi:hypothetical protein
MYTTLCYSLNRQTAIRRTWLVNRVLLGKASTLFQSEMFKVLKTLYRDEEFESQQLKSVIQQWLYVMFGLIFEIFIKKFQGHRLNKRRCSPTVNGGRNVLAICAGLHRQNVISMKYASTKSPNNSQINIMIVFLL